MVVYHTTQLTKWKQDETEFIVSLSESTNPNGSKSYVCKIPKPIVEKLKIPKKLTFKIKKNDKIEITKGDEK